MTTRNIGASIRDRLLNKARAEKLDYNLLLTRYAMERLLYRLSISGQRDQFMLKGGCCSTCGLTSHIGQPMMLTSLVSVRPKFLTKRRSFAASVELRSKMASYFSPIQ